MSAKTQNIVVKSTRTRLNNILVEERTYESGETRFFKVLADDSLSQMSRDAWEKLCILEGTNGVETASIKRNNNGKGNGSSGDRANWTNIDWFYYKEENKNATERVAKILTKADEFYTINGYINVEDDKSFAGGWVVVLNNNLSFINKHLGTKDNLDITMATDEVLEWTGGTQKEYVISLLKHSQEFLSKVDTSDELSNYYIDINRTEEEDIAILMGERDAIDFSYEVKCFQGSIADMDLLVHIAYDQEEPRVYFVEELPAGEETTDNKASEGVNYEL